MCEQCITRWHSHWDQKLAVYFPTVSFFAHSWEIDDFCCPNKLNSDYFCTHYPEHLFIMHTCAYRFFVCCCLPMCKDFKEVKRKIQWNWRNLANKNGTACVIVSSVYWCKSRKFIETTETRAKHYRIIEVVSKNAMTKSFPTIGRSVCVFFPRIFLPAHLLMNYIRTGDQIDNHISRTLSLSFSFFSCVNYKWFLPFVNLMYVTIYRYPLCTHV